MELQSAFPASLDSNLSTSDAFDSEIVQPEPFSRLACVDLFAGAGGFSLAASNMGMDVVAAIEFNKHACNTYSRNIVRESRSTKLYPDNILNLDPATIKKAHFSEDRICDIVLGGPPCQGFSTHRIKNAGIDDPRNILLLRYFEFVRVLTPKVFLMENVPGLLWPRHANFLAEFYKQGKKAGYELSQPIVLDARDFGVPQRRKRVFVLGVKNGVAFDFAHWPPKATHGNEKAREIDPDLSPWKSGEAFGVFAEAPLGDPNNHHMNHSRELIQTFENTPPNGGSRSQSGRVLPCHAEHDGHKDVYGRIDPKKPGPTMTTACINPSKGRFVHPTLHHGITLRQAARFQTFPDNFVFEGGLTAAGCQIGNAVPVKLGEALIRTVQRGLGMKTFRNRQEVS